jgi:hypothetical protein
VEGSSKSRGFTRFLFQTKVGTGFVLQSLWPFFCGSIAQILSEVCYPEGIDLLKDRQALQRLTEAAEKAKMELSGVQEAGTTHDSHVATCTLEQ